MGVHQKIDRLARRNLSAQLGKRGYFPTEHEILHFEGLNGPDGIKRKSPGRDEPWHYIDPSDPSDRVILDMIADHKFNLSKALREKDDTRASFEAAWMAHAIVDGFTPAHHYPLEEKLEELRGGEGLETRNTTKEKLILPGKNRRIQLRNNWEYWGARGVMTTHLGFELGVATTIAAGRLGSSVPTTADLKRVREGDFESLFYDALHEIAAMKMYEEFGRKGWNRRLARETREVLVPDIVRIVTLGWYDALQDAKK